MVQELTRVLVHYHCGVVLPSLYTSLSLVLVVLVYHGATLQCTLFIFEDGITITCTGELARSAHNYIIYMYMMLIFFVSG